MSEPAPGAATQEVEAIKRKLHERIGAWVVEHWTELLSAFGGLLGGAGTMYLLFHSQISDTQNAANELKTSVAELKGTVAQLVTQNQLQQVRDRVKELEDWKCYAQQYRSKQPPPGCARPEQN